MTLAPRRREGRYDLLWLALGALILFLPQLGARDLWNPNEPLYGRAVVEMQQRGDWIVPTVNGDPFLEKPILYFWLARLSALAVGRVDPLSLRLPSAASALLCVLLVYLLVRPAAGRFRALLAGALTATTFAVFWSGHWIQMDLLLTTTTLAALLAAVRVLDHGAPSRRGWLLFGLAAGVGVLAKGPLGLVCPGLVLLVYAAVTRRTGAVARGMLWALPVAALVVLPYLWLLWGTHESAALLGETIRQNVTRFFDPWDHRAPWWYYLVFFWSDMAPWSLFVPLAVGLVHRDEQERRLDRLAWCWIAALVVFFSLSESKRSIYLLPAAPAVALLVSGVAERLAAGALGRARRRAAASLLGFYGIVLVAGAAYIPLRAIPRYPVLEAPGRATALLLGAGGLAVLIGLVRSSRRYVAAGSALFALTASLYLLSAVWLLPATNAYKSARPFCEEVTRLVGPDRPLRAFRPWKWRAAYSYYADREIPRLSTPAELRAYWSRPDRVFVIVERSEESGFLEVAGRRDPLVRRDIGDNAVALFSNR